MDKEYRIYVDNLPEELKEVCSSNNLINYS